MNEKLSSPSFVDMAPLIIRLRLTIESFSGSILSHDLGTKAKPSSGGERRFPPSRRSSPIIVLAAETGLELGHPQKASECILLLTRTSGLVHSDRITRVGPDFPELYGDSRHFAQVVLLQLAENSAPDPFDLENAQYLTDRIDGYMVRSLPGRLWVRIHRERLKDGFNCAKLGKTLVAAYSEFEMIQAIEIIFVTSGRSDVEMLTPLGKEAQILLGRHKKLVLSENGDVSCSELDCTRCPEKAACDALRDVVITGRI